MRLIKKSGSYPPGAYSYVDPRTGIKFTTMISFDSRVWEIINSRKRNPSKYPPETDGRYLTYEFTANELAEYTCNRLGNNPRYCTDGSMTVARSTRPTKLGRVSERLCPECGGKLTDKICQTCTGYRVVGFYCPACGKSFPFSPRRR